MIYHELLRQEAGFHLLPGIWVWKNFRVIYISFFWLKFIWDWEITL